ncbi:MAG: ParA family protein [Acidimicrobiales bacterium]|mgnify:FL=1|nr:ParA family protein [Acidimicrobiales bacterium]
MARVVAVANQKGGVAKTTTVHSLGVALAEAGRKVLLVDLDPQASLTWACGVDPDALDRSMHEVMLRRSKAGDAVIRLDNGVSLLPSTIDLAGAEMHLLTRTGREYVLRKALERIVDDYDRVLIDCPPSLGILTINGLTAADEVIIPLQCESLGQRGVTQLMETIDDVRSYTNRDLVVSGVIATMFDGRTKLAHQVVDEVRRAHGLEVFDPPVPKSVRAAEAPGHGLSVLEHAPRSRPAEAYRELAERIFGTRKRPAKGKKRKKAS